MQQNSGLPKVMTTAGNAHLFWLAASRCFERRFINPKHFNMLAVPGVVCLAFSIELSLKALLESYGQPPRSHNLRTLFGRLPPNVQGRVQERCGIPRGRFRTNLQECANAFEEWRYLNEQTTADIDAGFLQKLADVLHELLNAKDGTPS